MARVTWKGKGGDPLPSIEVQGVTFPLDEAVEVDDAALLELLAGNPHFEVGTPASAGAGGDEPEPDPESGDDGDDGGEDKPVRAAARRHVVSRVQQHIATRKKK